MTPARQYSLFAEWDGTNRIFTLPAQLRPFKLAAIHFRFETNGVVVARDVFIRIRYGETATVWEVITTSTAGATVILSVNASPDIGGVQYPTTQSALYDELVLVPLPTMILDEHATVEFGILGGQSADVADDGSALIEFVD